MPKNEFDVVVIGSGPGGEGSAMMAAKNGRSVAMVESHPEVGGGGVHWGTIPSKALRHAVQRLNELTHNPLLRSLGQIRRVAYPEVLKPAHGVIRQQATQWRRYYERNHVRLIRGQGRFKDADTIEVDAPDGGVERIKGKHMVIAAGSRPYRP